MTAQNPAKTNSNTDLSTPPPPEHLEAVYDKNVIQKVPASMRYVAPSTERALLRRDVAGMDSGVEDAEWNVAPVWMHNGRLGSSTPELDQNGFELLNQEIPTDIDFSSQDDIMNRYYPACQQLLQSRLEGETGGANCRVYCFDHNVRRQNGSAQKPISLVHGDYTTVSAPRRLELLAEPPKANDVWKGRLVDERPSLLDPTVVRECLDGKRRFALINVWRSIDPDQAIQGMPLACMDAKTMRPSDLRILELRYTDRTGENFLLCEHADQKWYYFPGMDYREAMLIKQWDTADDTAAVSAKFAIHSAFQDPTTPPGAVPRQSIEVRCVVIWE